MKARIIGFVLVALILGGLYVVTESGNQSTFPAQNTQQPDTSGLQGLKIN